MFTGGSHDREIARLALPALGALAAEPLVSLVDTAFVGRLGAEALAAMAIATAVLGIVFALANFLPYGATPLIAAALGRRDLAGAAALGRGTLLLAFAVGFGAMALLVVFAAPFLEVMGAGADTMEPADTYLRIRAIGVPALLVILAGHGIYRGHQNTVTPLVVSLAVSGLNLVLDPLLIFGLDLGLSGAAWASVAAQWAGAIAFLLLFNAPEIEIYRPMTAQVRPLLGAGSALVLRTGALIAAFTVATAVVARIGTVSLAAHVILFQVWIFLALVVDSLAIAAQALVGRLAGADAAAARDAADRLIGLGMLVGIAASAGLVLIRPVLPGLFTDDEAVVGAVLSVYPIVVLTQPLNALVFVWDGIAIGARAFTFLAGAMGVAAAVTIALLLAAVPLGWGLTGVWLAISTLMVIRAIGLALWYRFGPIAPARGPSPLSPAA